MNIVGWRGAFSWRTRLMVSAEVQENVRRAELIYAQRLRAELEPTYRGSFVAIDPDSADFFLGRTIEEAAAAARLAHPDQLSHVIRIGFPTAVEIGNCP
jgi:hypothetical protein